jgi:peptidoglycan/xylan/chitin deacetylase (PgdA/CDA1 family)
MSATTGHRWPRDGSLAVSIVVVVEEGGERTPADGDGTPEPFAEGYSPEGRWRNWFVESMWEYGPRAGLGRLLDGLARHDVRASFAWTSTGARRNPDAVRRILAEGHEIIAAGRRALPGPTLTVDEERSNILEGVAELTALVAGIEPQAVPVGWFGRWPTAATARAVLESGLQYTSDSHAADAPFLVDDEDGTLLAIPWTPDLDDGRFWCDPRMAGYRTADDFLDVMERTARTLAREARHSPRMMTIVLRPRISGHPARFGAIERFMEGSRHDPRIRFLTRRETMQAWNAAGSERTRAS